MIHYSLDKHDAYAEVLGYIGQKLGYDVVDRRTAVSSAIAIASSPIDNIVTEFLPDVAKHFSIRIVLIQRIVNHIALTGGQS